MSDNLSQLDELAPALAAFQAEMPVIPNTERARIQSTNGQGYAYSYADLGTIAPIVMPLLAKHGLSFTAIPSRVDGAGLLVGMLLHKSGQNITGELPLAGRTPQEIGSAITYGRRYLLCCLTGVVTDDDDDGQLAQRAATARSSALAGQASSSEQTQRPKGGNPAERAPARASEPSEPVDPRHSKEPLNTSSKLARAMYAGIREAGIGKDDVHTFMSEVVGREITSSKELTEAEAHRVLDYLPERTPVAPPPPEDES
jgi:hypothetical protein